MLVPILKGKLPHQVRQNLARHLSKQEWSFSQLREAILNEMRILEVGIDTNSFPPLLLRLHSLPKPKGTKKQKVASYTSSSDSKRWAYCKGTHSSRDCTVVTDCEKRWSLVKPEGLSFNCLGGHKSSACQSRNRCRNGKGNHHTSLCTGIPGKSSSSPRDQLITTKFKTFPILENFDSLIQ